MADDRTYLVTGANRGIGFATAEGLAAGGGRVILACRDLGRGEDAEESIRRNTGNPHLYVVELDLASLESVREAAADLLDRFERIDVLINNAGAFTHDRRQSPDGLELQFAVNHLGHFLLTHLLRDRLIASAPARVVTVASRAHHRGRLDLEGVEAGGRAPYDGYQAYADSKLANVLFTRSLAARLAHTGVTANAVHPGVVQTRMLTDYLKAPPVELDPHHRSPAEGAAPSIYLVTAPDVADVTGAYFEDREVAPVAVRGQDPEAARALWEWSERTAGLA